MELVQSMCHFGVMPFFAVPFVPNDYKEILPFSDCCNFERFLR